MAGSLTEVAAAPAVPHVGVKRRPSVRRPSNGKTNRCLFGATLSLCTCHITSTMPL